MTGYLCASGDRSLSARKESAQAQIPLTIVAAQPLAGELQGPQGLAARVFTIAQR